MKRRFTASLQIFYAFRVLHNCARAVLVYLPFAERFNADLSKSSRDANIATWALENDRP